MNRHPDHAARTAAHASRLPVRAAGGAERASQPPLEPDCINGSQERLSAFLAEMAALSGGAGASLELLLGDLLTISTPAPGGGLTVVVQLPRASAYRPRTAAPAGCALAWHVELACEVLVRRVPLSALRSEPEVLDAILESAELARSVSDMA